MTEPALKSIHDGLTFEVTSRSYAITIENDAFTDLLDSESYVTSNAAYRDGNETLLDKLKALPSVEDVDYNGHFGNCVYFSLPVDDDTPEIKEEIAEVINDHLAWCKTLPKAPHVVQQRAEAA